MRVSLTHTWDDDLVLLLDPGMAFGTGTHPSTQLSMLALEESLRSGDRVLDVGVGSGILSIAAAMLGVVIANNLLLLFICWELVGLTSYLLIGFWYHKPSAAAAAKKAFITTRVGDLAFLLGMAWLSRVGVGNAYLTSVALPMTVAGRLEEDRHR